MIRPDRAISSLRDSALLSICSETARRPFAAVRHVRGALRQNNFNFGAVAQFPNGVGFSVTNTNVNYITPEPVSGLTGRQIAPPSYGATFPVYNTMPTIYSWNLGIQRDLGRDFVLDLAYVGNHEIHLMIQRAINRTAPGFYLDNPNALPSVNNYSDALRPYRGFGGITSIETSGTSEYNACKPG